MPSASKRRNKKVHHGIGGTPVGRKKRTSPESAALRRAFSALGQQHEEGGKDGKTSSGRATGSSIPCCWPKAPNAGGLGAAPPNEGTWRTTECIACLSEPCRFPRNSVRNLFSWRTRTSGAEGERRKGDTASCLPSCHALGLRGSWMATTVPACGSEVMAIVPWCRWTVCRAMARPRPLPP